MTPWFRPSPGRPRPGGVSEPMNNVKQTKNYNEHIRPLTSDTKSQLESYRRRTHDKLIKYKQVHMNRLAPTRNVKYIKDPIKY